MSGVAITAVVFDFGGVIVEGPFDAFGALEDRAGVPRGAVRAVNSRNPDDNAWARIERGEIGADEFVARFEAEARAAGVELPGRDVLDIVTRVSHADHRARPVMRALLADLRSAGLQLALITNNINPLESRWVTDAFHVVVESCRIGIRKPERAIYEHTLALLGVEAASAVMLDDLGINLKPARALGMATIKVVDPEAAAAELRALLGPRLQPFAAS